MSTLPSWVPKYTGFRREIPPSTMAESSLGLPKDQMPGMVASINGDLLTARGIMIDTIDAVGPVNDINHKEQDWLSQD